MGTQPIRSPQGDKQRPRAARPSQQEGFECQWPDQIEAGRSQSGAHGEFVGSGDGAGQEEICQVRTGNQQYEPGQAEQHCNDNATALVTVRGQQIYAAPAAPNIVLCKVGGKSVAKGQDKSFPLRHGNRSGAPADDVYPLTATGGAFAVSEAERAENADLSDYLIVVGPRGQDANDFVGFAFNANGSADDVRCTAEMVLP